MRKNPPAAMFAIFVWSIFLILAAHYAYEKIMKTQIPTVTVPKTMRELLDGSN